MMDCTLSLKTFSKCLSQREEGKGEGWSLGHWVGYMEMGILIEGKRLTQIQVV